MPLQTGYCTNVHAGASLAQTRANLQRYALAVKRAVSPAQPLGLGLWLSAPAAREMLATDAVAAWADWLRDVGLVPFTFNGFPHGDFHQRIVKHAVYLPAWDDPERLRYTLDLAELMDAFLPPGLDGTISTLPVAWGRPLPPPDRLHAAAHLLRKAAAALARIEQERGRLISLCLEPEPGCVLETSADVVRFFEDSLLPGGDEAVLRRYLRVCHDVCHAVVMFEDQAEVLARYRAAGIAVGKVQVSSSVVLPLDHLAPPDRPAALDQLRGFHEPRYLHQTCLRHRPGEPALFYEDLPEALAAADPASPAEWRVHFHVPIYLRSFGRLFASQQAILNCLRDLHQHGGTDHFEVETYAWSVLPEELREPDLARGIARELSWLRGVHPLLTAPPPHPIP